MVRSVTVQNSSSWSPKNSVPVPLQTTPKRIPQKEVSNSGELVQTDSDVFRTSDFVFLCHICKEICDKAEFVRDHPAMLHVDYKYSCSETFAYIFLKPNVVRRGTLKTSTKVQMQKMVLLLKRKKMVQFISNRNKKKIKMNMIYQTFQQLLQKVEGVEEKKIGCFGNIK